MSDYDFIATVRSSERACNNELTLFVEVAAVLPLPTRSRSSWGSLNLNKLKLLSTEAPLKLAGREKKQQ
jgi:hypothetical protein